jgi:hypothetical protein
MEQRRPPEYIIEVFADPSSVKDVVRGISPRMRRTGRQADRRSRDFTYNLLPQVLSLYPAEDTRYSGFNAAIC